MWNRAIEELTGVGAQKVVGSRLSALPEPWKGLLERFIDAPTSTCTNSAWSTTATPAG